MLVPNITLNNGQKMPNFGLGTYKVFNNYNITKLAKITYLFFIIKAKDGEAQRAAQDAIDAGYRHFDCAYYYQNEKEIGEGIKAKIDEGVVKREDLFITSKVIYIYHLNIKLLILFPTFNHIIFSVVVYFQRTRKCPQILQTICR